MQPDRTVAHRFAHFLRPLLAVGLLAALIPATLHAEQEATAPTSEAWHVDADRIEYDQAAQAYLAKGHVSIRQAGYTLFADTVRLNQKSRMALAQGNVRLESGQDVLSGSQLQFDMDKETGTLTDGAVFISQNHLYLSGKEIRKTGPQTYTASKVRVTSCDDEDPAWKITGSDFKVTIEGYGTAKHAALWAGKLPLLYSPYLVFPVKLERQSGLLMPVLGFSDRRGTEYTQPLFWAINPSSDATLYTHHMTKRGTRAGIEYRYVLDQNTSGTFLIEGFDDAKVDDGSEEATQQWGYGDDAALRTNRDRYWLRGKHDHDFGGGLNAKLDIDVVSDQDYLNEFRGSYNGFSETRRYFQETFGREIDDYNDPIRLNRLNLNRAWDRYTLNADLRWYDDVIKRRNDEIDDTVQELPDVGFDGIKQPTGKTPFFHDLSSSYTNYYRLDGTRGHRTDLYPRVYYPFDLFGAVTVEPSVGLRQTTWFIDQEAPTKILEDDTHFRNIYDVKLDLSTELFRIYDLTLAGSDRMKHALTPEIIYEYIPDQDQSDLPLFDAAVDRIERKNLITYSINNTLTARAPKASGDNTAAFRYTPYLRFKLSQSFDINKHNEDDPEPLSNITAELDLTPGKYIAIDADAQWSVYDHRQEALNCGLTLWSPRGDLLAIDYRFTRESDETDDEVVEGVESVSLDGTAKLSHRWRIRAGIENNIRDDQLIETNLGATYQSQCWGVDFDYWVEYTDDRDNHSFSVMFHLLGLGSVPIKQ